MKDGISGFSRTGNGIIVSDFSELEGTACYCSPESAAAIRRRIAGLPLRAIHYIGTGDYHYQSLFWLERIRNPFTLVLIDNHPDDQDGAFGGELLSCGGWVPRARELPGCRDVIWINGLPAELPQGGSIYLSVDIDVLSEEYAHTNWDQGTMSLEELRAICSDLAARCRIEGADLCGGLAEDKGGTETDRVLNEKALSAIASSIGNI